MSKSIGNDVNKAVRGSADVLTEVPTTPAALEVNSVDIHREGLVQSPQPRPVSVGAAGN